MPDNKSRNGWNEWSRYILEELKRQGVELKETREELLNKISTLEGKLDTFREEFVAYRAAAEARTKMISFITSTITAVVVGVLVAVISAALFG